MGIGVMMRATAGQQLDTFVQVGELLLVVDFGKQALLEINQSGMKNPLSLVQGNVLARCGLKSFGRRACRYQYLDGEVLLGNCLHQTFQGGNGHKNRMGSNRLPRLAAAQ